MHIQLDRFDYDNETRIQIQHEGVGLRISFLESHTWDDVASEFERAADNIRNFTRGTPARRPRVPDHAYQEVYDVVAQEIGLSGSDMRAGEGLASFVRRRLRDHVNPLIQQTVMSRITGRMTLVPVVPPVFAIHIIRAMTQVNPYVAQRLYEALMEAYTEWLPLTFEPSVPAYRPQLPPGRTPHTYYGWFRPAGTPVTDQSIATPPAPERSASSHQADGFNSTTLISTNELTQTWDLAAQRAETPLESVLSVSQMIERQRRAIETPYIAPSFETDALSIYRNPILPIEPVRRYRGLENANITRETPARAYERVTRDAAVDLLLNQGATEISESMIRHVQNYGIQAPTADAGTERAEPSYSGPLGAGDGEDTDPLDALSEPPH